MGCVNTCPQYLIPNGANGNCDNCNTLALGFSYLGACHAGATCPDLYGLVNLSRNGCETCLSLSKFYDGEEAMGCVVTCPIYLVPNLITGNCDNCQTLMLGFSYNSACVAGAGCPLYTVLVNIVR